MRVSVNTEAAMVTFKLVFYFISTVDNLEGWGEMLTEKCKQNKMK